MAMSGVIMFNPLFLNTLGWKPFFQQQLSLEEYENNTIARVVAVHRDHIECLTESGTQRFSILASTPTLATGDWITIDEKQHISRCLDRFSLIERKSPGSQVQRQLMVANIDTVFIVSSLNDDFSLNRIERYLAISKETNIDPVVILTKKDLCPSTEEYAQQVQSLDSNLPVFAVSVLELESLQPLLAYCQTGQSITLLGSSGVGKSTLINGLIGSEQLATAEIRESDSKGRHTTTKRQLIALETGGVIIDTPGMRELQIVNCAEGLQETFSDVAHIAKQCKFGDCQHQTEPGCAIQQAIGTGELSARRLENYQRLLREEAHNTSSIAEKREKDKQLGKFYRSVLKGKQFRKESS